VTAKQSRGLQGSLLRLGQGLLVLIVATTFTFLALWQWDRAEGHQALKAELSRIAMLPPTTLTAIHEPQIALDGEDANRLVRASGRYLDTFRSQGQEEGVYEVALLEVAGSSPRAAILVARQIVADALVEVPLDSRIELVARLLPTQREDLDPDARIDSDGERLSRIDSALLVERLENPGLALYDGYLLLQSERIEGNQSNLNQIPDSIAEPTIPGYYWQHLSYVVIWSLMALLTLYLPFYQRKRNRIVL
jgi:cytochrome oxidase assembly protein ShyY1